MEFKIQKCALFPTLVISVENFLSEQQCHNIFEYIKSLDLHNHGSIIGDGESTHSLKSYTLEEISENVPNCEQLYDSLTKLVKEYSLDSGIKLIEGITNSWASIQNIDSILEDHTHPLSSISGVIYIWVDNNSSKIYFSNPNPFITHISCSATSRTTYSFDYYYFKPKIGQLLIFPSWLQHGSKHTKNNTSQRTIVSFNAI